MPLITSCHQPCGRVSDRREERLQLVASGVGVVHPDLDELLRVGAVEEQVAGEVGLGEQLALRQTERAAAMLDE